MDKGWQHLEVELGKAEQIYVKQVSVADTGFGGGGGNEKKNEKKGGGGAYVKFSN